MAMNTYFLSISTRLLENLSIFFLKVWARKRIRDFHINHQVESIRDALRCYFTMYGLGGDGLCRENWVEAHQTMGAAAQERAKNKDPIPMVFMANAYFDVIDEDDNGILNMQVA